MEIEKWTNLNWEADTPMVDQLNDVLDDLWRKRFTGKVQVLFTGGLIKRFFVCIENT